MTRELKGGKSFSPSDVDDLESEEEEEEEEDEEAEELTDQVERDFFRQDESVATGAGGGQGGGNSM